jgi:arginine:ornithine antiporter/lysine permease
MSQGELAGLSNPSTAELLQQTVHASWGGILMNLGVIIALLTSWLAFTIMIVQIPYAAALDGTFPKIFTKTNSHGAPSVSLFVTSTIMQLTMIMVYFANNAWNTMLSITSVMILPAYFACTLYLWKVCAKKQFPASASVKLAFAVLCGIAGSVYALWMIYAAGLKYLAMTFAFFAIGIPVFIWSQRNQPDNDNRYSVFSGGESFAAALIVIIAIGAVIAALTGHITL